jgi:hypothetical protein
MNLYVHSTDKVFINEINKKATITTIDKADVIFIDWIPKISMKYIESIQKRKQKFIIFDRFLSISVNEANLLQKQNVILTEPALNFRRKYFHYIPFWVKLKKFDDINLNENDRFYDLAYKGDLQGKTISFNEYYVPYTRAYPKSVYIENQKNILQDENSYYNSLGITRKDVINFNEVKVTMVIGSPLDYEIGYLDYQFFNALSNNCIPLIPNEHKYFSLLSPRVNDKIFDINYIIDNYDKTYIGYILDIYKIIEKYYPEMVVENVVDEILNLIK